MQNNNKIWFLHMLRGVAALMVLICHYLSMFWQSNQSVINAFSYIIPKKNNDSLIFFNFIKSIGKMHIDFGALGVAIFFIISGFVISMSLEKLNIKKFFYFRFMRIYPLYIVGVSITFFLIFLYTKLYNLEFTYNLKDLIIQMSLLREYFWVASMDGVSWTLEVEIKFYIIMAIISYFKLMNRAKFICLFCGAISVFNISNFEIYKNYLSINVLLYKIVIIIASNGISIIYMFIGVCFYNHYKNIWNDRKFISTLVIVYILFVMAFLNGPESGLRYMYFINYTLALIIFTLCYINRECFKYRKSLNYLADISYPI